MSPLRNEHRTPSDTQTARRGCRAGRPRRGRPRQPQCSPRAVSASEFRGCTRSSLDHHRHDESVRRVLLFAERPRDPRHRLGRLGPAGVEAQMGQCLGDLSAGQTLHLHRRVARKLSHGRAAGRGGPAVRPSQRTLIPSRSEGASRYRRRRQAASWSVHHLTAGGSQCHPAGPASIVGPQAPRVVRDALR